MNCKFCNNFIPDDAKVCSICGKNVEEEAALVKAEAETVAETADTAETSEKVGKALKKKSLKLPTVIIIIAMAAFVCLYVFGDAASGCAQFNGWLSERVSTSQNEDAGNTEGQEAEEIGGVGNQTNTTEDENIDHGLSTTAKFATAGNGAAGLVGVIGIALLGKRASNNRKFRKQEKGKEAK